MTNTRIVSVGPIASRSVSHVLVRWVLFAAVSLLALPAGPAWGQGGWSASLSVHPFPPAYPSAWEFDPNIASLTITAVPGTDPRYRITMTLSQGGAVVMSGASGDRSLSPTALSDIVYTPDLIDWPAASYSSAARGGLDQTERFPEGDYTLSVRVESAASGRLLAESTALLTISYPDPPMVLFPACGDELITAFPVFQWTPVQVPVQYPVHYVFRIVEVLEGQIPETALNSNVVWYEDLDIRDTNYAYPISAQPLEEGKTYAWQVQVLDEAGQPPATNNGRSEVCTFSVPQGISTEPPVTSNAAITLVRTTPDAPFDGSSFAGLEDKPFIEVLRRLDDLVRNKSTKSISLPLPSLRGFEPIALPDAEVSIDSILGSFAIASRIEILGQTVDVVLAGLKPGMPADQAGSSENASPDTSGWSGLPGDFVFGFRPVHFDFGSLIAPLDGSLLDDFDFGGNLLSMSSSAFELDPTTLPPLGAELFGLGAVDFTPGINFHQKIEVPGSVERLKRPCELLGIDGSQVELTGTIDVSLDDLRSGNPLTHAVDLSLSATMTGNDPAWFPEWLDAGARTLSFDMDSTLHVHVGAQLSATLDGSPRSLRATVDVAALDGSGPVVLRAEMDDTWESPFGVAWLDLKDVGIELTAAEDSTSVAITGSFDVGAKVCEARIDVLGVGENQTARFTGSVDELGLADALSFAARAGLPVPDGFSGDALTLTNVTVSFESADVNSFAISSHARVLNVDGDFLISMARPEGADPQVLVGVRVPKFGLNRLHSALDGTPVGGLTVPEIAFTYLIPLSGSGGTSGTGESGAGEPGEEGAGETEGSSGFGGIGGIEGITISSVNLSLPALKFFRPVFGSGRASGPDGETSEGGSGTDDGASGGSGEFSLSLLPGLNLGGLLPLAPLGSDLLNALGIQNPDLGVHLSGRLGADFGAITGGSFSDLVGWRLTAKLPPRTLGTLPDWLHVAGGGDRTLNISMDPDFEVSVSDILAAELDGKTRLFRFGADLAVQDSTAAGALRGTLVEPWESPYGLTWLELKNVEIEVSTDTDGNASARLFSAFDIGAKSFSTTIDVLTTDAGEAARFTATIDELGLRDVFGIARKMGLDAPDPPEEDPFTLQNVTLSFESSSANTFAVSATVTVFETKGDFLVSVAKRGDADPTLLLGVRIPGFPLADLAPPLGGTMVGDLNMPQVAFTIVQQLGGASAGGGGAGEETSDGASTEGTDGGGASGGLGIGALSFPSASLSPAAVAFFRPVFGGLGGAGGGGAGTGDGTSEGTNGGDSGGGQDFTLVMSPGLNLGGRLPLAPLGPEILKVLGFSGGSPEVLLRGSLGLELGVLSGSGFAKLSTWSLHAELPPRDRKNLPDWLELDPNTQRTLDISKNPSGVDVSITDVMKANLDGARRTFVFSRSLATQDSSAAVTLRGEMTGGWKQPYGIKWLDLDRVSIELDAGTEGAGARLASTTELVGKTFDVSIELRGGKGEKTATFTGSVDELSASEFIKLIQDQLDIQGPLFDWSPPAKLLDLKKPTITVVVGTETAFSVSAGTTLFGQSADLMFFSRKERGQEAQFMLGLQPQELSLSAMLPDLKSPVLEAFKLPKGALVISKSERKVESKDLTPDTRAFYGGIYGTDDFNLDIAPGLSIVAPLPLGDLDANNPLKKALGLLSPDAAPGKLVLEGTLPGAILGLGGSSGLSGLSLRANLPAISPDADWLVEAQLAIAITGRPSVGFAGHLTVKVDEDELTFLTEINIAAVPSGGVELGLMGALEAEEPWVAPLGIKWITFNEVRLKTAINPVSVKLGFLARFKIGEKDIEVIAMLPINYYTGVPTGLGIKGASEEGVALADIADMQNAMARAAGRSQPRLPIEELPNVAVKDLDFRFSTLEDPDLDLRIGTTVSGQLWVEMDPDELTNFAGIYFDVGLDGILGQAHLGTLTLGPVQWKDALLDIAVTLPDRHMIIEGGLDLGFAAGRGKMNMAKRKMSLDADLQVLGKFKCAVKADGALSLGASNLLMHGELQNDFNGAIANEVLNAFKNIGSDGGGAVMAAAQSSVDAAQRLYDEREQALKLARALIARGREKVAAERDETKREMNAAKAAMNQAKSAKDAAYRSWKNTPRREVKLRAARWKAHAKKNALYSARKAAYAGKKASYAAKVAAYRALKPVDEYKQIVALRQAADIAKKRIDERRRDLERMKDDLKAVAASILPNSITIQSAAFTAMLARASQGGGVDMKMVVAVDGKQYPLGLSWKFGNTKENAAAIVAQLISKIRKA